MPDCMNVSQSSNVTGVFEARLSCAYQNHGSVMTAIYREKCNVMSISTVFTHGAG